MFFNKSILYLRIGIKLYYLNVSIGCFEFIFNMNFYKTKDAVYKSTLL